jgi:adenylate cyclase
MPAPEMAAVEPKSVYQVGDMLLDVGQARLTRAGSEIPLPRLSFDLLVALVAAAPRLLTTDELMNRVWRGVIVSPETISQRVKLLRDAIGDDATHPRYIASVRGRGYRLVADVQLVAGDSSGSMRPGLERVPADSTALRRGPWHLAAALALLALLILLYATWSGRQARTETEQHAAPARASVVAVLPFVDLSGAEPGSTLARGIAETLRHQLASLEEIDVIGYSSSTVLGGTELDAREIGRRLRARYLLGGSVQGSGTSLRVTAQLTDAETGLQVWSVRFDREPEDVFAMEDEIAIAVAKALALAVDADTRGRLTRQGTTNFDSYLAYLQGRALLTSGKVGDAQYAALQFERATDGDPQFAPAYVARAEALVFAAEYATGTDRGRDFARVIPEAQALIAQALELDPTLGSAYLARGYLRAFSSLAAAEADLRRGLKLSPNDAEGYAKLASVVFVDRRRGSEALALLDRARRLEPLEPEYDVTKAVYLLYGKGDVAGADDLLVQVLRREPLYAPALGRLAELRFCCQGRLSAAVRLGQQALALDPNAEWTRRVVIRAAVGLGSLDIARATIESAPQAADIRRVPLLMREGNTVSAAAIGYQALADDAVLAIDEPMVVEAIRQEARRTRDFARAIATLESAAGVSWGPDGRPRLRDRAGLKISTVALADMLACAGQRERAQHLLNALLADMDYEARVLGRGDRWFAWSKPLALALLEQPDASLAELERDDLMAQRVMDAWYYGGRDPAFDSLRRDPRFEAITRKLAAYLEAERPP